MKKEELNLSTFTLKEYKEKFNVFTLTSIDDKNKHCDDLTMVIIKDGVKVKLNSEEVHQVINSLPRTFGGIY